MIFSEYVSKNKARTIKIKVILWIKFKVLKKDKFKTKITFKGIWNNANVHNCRIFQILTEIKGDSYSKKIILIRNNKLNQFFFENYKLLINYKLN